MVCPTHYVQQLVDVREAFAILGSLERLGTPAELPATQSVERAEGRRETRLELA